MLATGRSRNVTTITISQTIEQEKSIYTKEEANQLFSLSEILCVLSCRDMETAEVLSRQSGFVEITKSSTNRNSVSKVSSIIENVSTERRHILEPDDLMRLRREKGVVLFIEGVYCRVRRIRYYEDRILAHIVKGNLEYNEAYRKAKAMKKQKDEPQNEVIFFDEDTLTEEEKMDFDFDFDRFKYFEDEFEKRIKEKAL